MRTAAVRGAALVEMEVDYNFPVFFFGVNVEAGIVSAHHGADAVHFAAVAHPDRLVADFAHRILEVFVAGFETEGHVSFLYYILVLVGFAS